MSPLPNIREFSDNNLAESLSDSEELLALKYNKQMQWWWEAQECHKCEERKQQEQQEWEHCKHEEHKHCEREEREAQEACKRRDCKEREKSAHEEVRRGKVSAQQLKRQCPWGATN